MRIFKYILFILVFAPIILFLVFFTIYCIELDKIEGHPPEFYERIEREKRERNGNNTKLTVKNEGVVRIGIQLR